jgi:hypothetical protein
MSQGEFTAYARVLKAMGRGCGKVLIWIYGIGGLTGLGFLLKPFIL